MTRNNDDAAVRAAVREHYASTAKDGAAVPTAKEPKDACCAPSCCGGTSSASLQMGYSSQDLANVPQGADLGLGCGNPQAMASLVPGETVLDLGAGAGFDSFLAAHRVGPDGRVIGVDMTAEMVAKARSNAARAGFENVDFRLGEIERLPVADGEIDAIISNCVINLSPEKSYVVSEAFRVLKPGGRLAISDIVATAVLPDSVKQDMALFTGCMAGASSIDELESMLGKVGFENIRIEPKDESKEFIRDWAPGRKIEEYVVSATIEAIKPEA
ncbi:MAG: arsenite methyltransferase [Hyphomicrobiaceae bacterium]|nr:arsenite methyltransferase [Hyphomicrobiaceae bacterium]